MTRLPSALLRSLAVLGIGATIAIAHVNFAAAASMQASKVQPVRVASADVETTGSLARAPLLADNCYFERQDVKMPNGKTVVRPVYECD